MDYKEEIVKLVTEIQHESVLSFFFLLMSQVSSDKRTISVLEYYDDNFPSM